MKDKTIYVTRSNMPTFEEYCDRIKGIWDSHWMTNMGPLHNELEEELKKRLGVDNISLFTNGHLALELSLQAFNLSGEVITTPFTFASTTHAIVRNGLTPVFCDINPYSCTIDENRIEELITEKTSAILPVHVYGNICNVEKIRDIADRHNLVVLYDAAHAFKESYKGKSVVSFGDASMLSFHATKVFNTIEGGAVAYKDEKIGKKLYQLKNFGIKDEETIDGIGSNAKMNEFQAAMGLCNLKYVDNNISRRKVISERYDEGLKNVDGITSLLRDKDIDYNYAYYPIFVDKSLYGIDRNELFNKLKDNNILARKYFYPITSEYDCFSGKYNSKLTPIAKRMSEEVITLPLYPELEIQDIDRICKFICDNSKIS